MVEMAERVLGVGLALPQLAYPKQCLCATCRLAFLQVAFAVNRNVPFFVFPDGYVAGFVFGGMFVPKNICLKCNELKFFFEINFVGFLLRSKNSSYLCIVVSKVLSDVIYCKSNPKAYCLR